MFFEFVRVPRKSLRVERQASVFITRDIAVYGCKRAPCIDHDIAAFSVNLPHGKQMVAVIIFSGMDS
jgi:hypothetical protein